MMRCECADRYGVSACGCHYLTTTVPYVPVPEYHRKQAELFRAMFRPVPMTDAEKLPDPDYGF